MSLSVCTHDRDYMTCTECPEVKRTPTITVRSKAEARRMLAELSELWQVRRWLQLKRIVEEEPE